MLVRSDQRFIFELSFKCLFFLVTSKLIYKFYTEKLQNIERDHHKMNRECSKPVSHVPDLRMIVKTHFILDKEMRREKRASLRMKMKGTIKMTVIDD